MDRLIDWVAFTPLQNATGDPAISLPLAESAAGMPVGMMLLGRRGAKRPGCWNWPTNSKRRGRGRASSDARLERVGAEGDQDSLELAALLAGQVGHQSAFGCAHTGVGPLEQLARPRGSAQRAASGPPTRAPAGSPGRALRVRAAPCSSPAARRWCRVPARRSTDRGSATGSACRCIAGTPSPSGSSTVVVTSERSALCDPVQQITERLVFEEVTHINHLDIYQPD